jgi:DNA-directed RNA polymerase specialized sigma24 family protein
MGTVRYTDNQLISMIRNNHNDGLACLNAYHREPCINFMKGKYDDEDEIKDIFQEVILIFYEKVQDVNFCLTVPLRNYLISVCRNQIYVRLKKEGRLKDWLNASNEFAEFSLNQIFIKEKIIGSEDSDGSDDFEKVNSILEEDEDIDSQKIGILRDKFIEMKEKSSICHKILESFWYQNKSMEQIAFELQYKNARTVINLKARCQRKLKLELFKRMKNVY